MARIRPGHRIGFIVIGANGMPFRFNGSCAYYQTYNLSHHAAELFWEKEDAQWVFNHEKKLFERLAERDDEYKAEVEGLKLMRVEVPVKFEPSANVRALRMAHEEMNKTGYFPYQRRMNRVLREGLKLKDV